MQTYCPSRNKYGGLKASEGASPKRLVLDLGRRSRRSKRQ